MFAMIYENLEMGGYKLGYFHFNVLKLFLVLSFYMSFDYVSGPVF